MNTFHLILTTSLLAAFQIRGQIANEFNNVSEQAVFPQGPQRAPRILLCMLCVNILSALRVKYEI